MSRAASGRPLRFLLMLGLGWALLRVGWIGVPFAGVTPPSALADAPLAADTSVGLRAMGVARSGLLRARALHHPTIGAPAVRARSPASRRPRPAIVEDMPIDLLDFVRFSMAFANREPASPAVAAMAKAPPGPGTLPPFIRPAGPDRWALSGWMLWRDGSAAASVAPGGRFGASQAGVRLDYDLTPSARGRASAYARVSTAFDRPASPEAALGLAWQPVRAIPVTLAAERRIALGEGGRNASALFVAGGIGPKDIGPSTRIEGYAQAGVVGFRSADTFVDGKAALSWRLPRTGVRPGLSLSGGAQPGLSRVDIGPELHLPVRIGNGGVRIGAEWRQRVAGNAAPGSGLTITLAANF